MTNAVWQDARYALRTLVKAPAFAGVAVITLALGVGANTAVFSVVRSVLLSPPPFADPDRLFIVSRTSPFSAANGQAGPWAYPDFEILRDQTTSLQVAAFTSRQVSLSGGGDPERLEAEMVSANYFALLGLMPALGRGLPAQGQGEPPSIVLGHELWQRRFGGELDVIGRTVELDDVTFQVTGVAPVGFRGQTGAVGIWVPITDAPALMNDPRRLARPFSSWLYVMARSGASASHASVAAELDVIAERLRVLREVSGPDAPGITLLSLSQATTDPKLRRTLVLLLGSAGLVLLITCVNLANVLLARAVGRRREIAVRRALGAGRARLVRQLFTENLLLGAVGGTIALGLAYATIRMLASVGPAEPAGFGSLRAGADLTRVQLDAQVLAFNFAAALIATMLFGLAPAVRAAKVDLSTSLKNGLVSFGTFSGGSPSRGGRSLLAGVQIALAVVLLTGAGLLLESLVRLQRVDVGVHEEDVLTVGLRLPPQRYDETAAASLYGRALERVATLPGVANAAVATSLPVSRNSGATIVRIEGRPTAEGERLTAGYHLVSGAYFETLGVPVVRGRVFDERDRAGSPRVAIINTTAALQFFPGEDPLGKRIWLGAGYGPEEDLAEVVGVVADVKYGAVEQPPQPHAYLSYAQYMEDAGYLLIRAARPTAERLLPSVRAEMAALDPNLPLFDVKTMSRRLAEATSRTRFGATLLGIFAALALALAAVGVYGVVSFSVAARTREIGIRRALGADDRTVVWQVMREGSVVALAGVAMGVLIALASVRLLESQLYEVRSSDLSTITTVATVLLASSLLATYIPSRRATRLDPLRALKSE